MTDKMQSLALAPVGNLDSYIQAANAWRWLKSCITMAIWKQLKR